MNVYLAKLIFLLIKKNISVKLGYILVRELATEPYITIILTNREATVENCEIIGKITQSEQFAKYIVALNQNSNIEIQFILKEEKIVKTKNLKKRLKKVVILLRRLIILKRIINIKPQIYWKYFGDIYLKTLKSFLKYNKK